MPIRKLNNGKHQADYADKKRNIPRTKRTFTKKKDAEEWLADMQLEGQNRLLGRRTRRLFGEALVKYLETESVHKKTHLDDVQQAISLRYPVKDGRRWILLEDTPLEEMVSALAAWTHDQRGIIKRAYLKDPQTNQQGYYQQRLNKTEPTWYIQPDPNNTDRPQPRQEISDKATIHRLNKTKGRGPVASDTMRLRHALVSKILTIAWRTWDWLENNIAERIQFEPPGQKRQEILNTDQLNAILTEAVIGLDLAILAATWIGWRQSNLLWLKWDHVVFPVYEQNGQSQKEIQIGYLWADGAEVKNTSGGHKADLIHPMTERIKQLFELAWATKNGPYVFQINGQPLATIDTKGRSIFRCRTAWAGAKRRAGISETFRWHDLRHTWATELTGAGVTDGQMMQLGGWSDPRMPGRYATPNIDHLKQAAELAGRT